jgi:hypothetical protein
MARCGTNSGYTKGCRCEACLTASRTYKQLWRDTHREQYNAQQRQRMRKYRNADAVQVDRKLLGDLLNELFPYGLTDDCPARQGRRIAA